MLEQFWTGLGGSLAERWLTLLLSPALAFWAGGLAAWAWHHTRTSVQPSSWRQTLNMWADVLGGLPVLLQGVLVVGLLIAVTLSAVVVGQLSRPVLRLFAGDWPLWLEIAGAPLLRARRGKIASERERLRELAAKESSTLTTRQRWRHRRLDRRYQQTPAAPRRQTATRLGNVLRAYEGRPAVRYGLDASVCWPQLWLVLPDQPRLDIGEARTRLNVAAQNWLWGVLFIGWTGLAWWALPAGLIVATLAYARAVSAAVTYGELFAASFDVYRKLLYEALRWPLPGNPADEPRSGAEITNYLRGSRSPKTGFTETAK